MKNEELYTLDVEDIIIPPGRVRKSLGNLDKLVASISSKGQLHPIIITKKGILLSGERRLEACRILQIPVLVRYREDLSEADMFEIEVMENAARLDFTWIESVTAIKKLHDLKLQQVGRKKWTFKHTGELLGKSSESTRLDYRLAEMLFDYPELTKLSKKSDAYKQMRNIMEDAALVALAERAVKNPIRKKPVRVGALELTDEEYQQMIDNINANQQSTEEAESEKAVLVEDIMNMEEFDENDKKILIELVSADDKVAGTKPEVIEQFKTETGTPREIMGRHFVCGDCFELFPKIQDERFDLIITDPPYGINIETTTAAEEIGVFEDSPEWLFKYAPDLLRECWRVLKPDSHMYLFFALGNPLHSKGSFYDFLIKTATKIGFEVDALPLVWVKGKYHGRSGNPNKYPGRAYELILYMRKGNLPLVIRGMSNVLIENPVQGMAKLHPTEKPRDLINNLLLRSAYKTEIEVFDPMGGSGAVIAACLRKMIPCYSIELDPQYHARGLDRLVALFPEFPLLLIQRLNQLIEEHGVIK